MPFLAGISAVLSDNPRASGTPRNFIRIAPDVRLGKDVVLNAFINLYGCQIGDETRIGTFR